MARERRHAKEEAPKTSQVPRKSKTWKATERVRARCPLCGMMPNVEKITEHELYPPELFLQKFGGSFPSGADGSHKGYCEYVPVNGDLLSKYIAFLKNRISELESYLASL